MKLRRLFSTPAEKAPALPLWERYKEIIARHARGRSFVDIGCLWQVHGAYAFYAFEHGASRVVGVDVNPATAEFQATNAAHDDGVRFVQGDLTDPALVERLGTFDVVFCTGVLYHLPDPLLALRHLRRLCTGTLVLGTATFPELDVPHGAVFLPYLDDAARARLNYRLPGVKHGLDNDFAPERSYQNWFWGLTPSAVAAMIRATGFTVSEIHPYPHSTCFVCAVAPTR